MTKKKALMLGMVGLALLLTGCMRLFEPPAPQEAVPIAPAEAGAVPSVFPEMLGEAIIHPGADHSPDQIIVGYRNDAIGRMAHEKVMKLVGRRVEVEVALDNLWLVQINIRNDLTVPKALGLVLMLAAGQLDPGNNPEKGIMFTEPDYLIPPPEPIPDPVDVKGVLDPKIYDPTADLRPFQWALPAINAEAAWATGYTGKNIIVAVLDTGIDSTHPDLVGQVIRRFDPWTRMEVDPTTNYDTHGHGTHCAGIIAAKNDGKGIVGLAYDAKLLDVRIFRPGSVGILRIAVGVKWAVDLPLPERPHILSNSWGGVGYSQAFKATMDYALANNVVVVASSGNDTYALWKRPASLTGVIAVAATNPYNRKAGFSTPGTWVSVAAPGVRVLSSVRSQISQPGTGRPLYYDYWSGTSMSCPYVAALAAMIREKHPTATPYQVKKLIEMTARDIEAAGFDPGTGHGLIQADRALTMPLPPNDGAALGVVVVTASSMPLRGAWGAVPFMDIALRKAGRVVAVGQTDFEGRLLFGVPILPVGLFLILEPGTYELVVGGHDVTYLPPTEPPGAPPPPIVLPPQPHVRGRTANRVTVPPITVDLAAGESKLIIIPVNTTLEVTVSWEGGAGTTDVDLEVFEPGEPAVGVPAGWTSPKVPPPAGYRSPEWGTFTPDVRDAPSGTETYTLKPVHRDYAFYPLRVRVAGGLPTLVRVTVRQNTVVETYTFVPTAVGVYPATGWPGWWAWWQPGPFVF